jgi:6-phosphogluconolactonase (cycloisomerase 2 family)
MQRSMTALAAIGLLVLGSCGGSSGPPTYSVGGTVAGLAAGVLILGSGGAVLSIEHNGAFTMPAPVMNGSPYALTVTQQPQPADGAPTQNCTVANGRGVSRGASVTNVSVVCANIARFAYVSSQDAERAGYVSAYAVDPSSGALAPLAGSPYATGQNDTQGLAVHPSGRYLYAINYDTVSGFAIDGSTGELSALPGSPFGFVEFAIDGLNLGIDPTGSFMYVTTANGNRVFAFAIDAGTGALQELAPVLPGGNQNGGPLSQAFDATGHYLYVADPGNSHVAAYAIDAASGALGPVAGGPFPTPSGPTGIAADPVSGYLYTPSAGASRLYAFGIADSGALSALPAPAIPPPLQHPSGIAIDPRGRFVFVLDGALISPASGQGAAQLVNYVLSYAIDPASGTLTGVSGSPFALAVNPSSGANLAIEPSGKFLYWTFYGGGAGVGGELGVAPVDPVSGALGGGIATATELNAHVYTGFIAFLP